MGHYLSEMEEDGVPGSWKRPPLKGTHQTITDVITKQAKEVKVVMGSDPNYHSQADAERRGREILDRLRKDPKPEAVAEPPPTDKPQEEPVAINPDWRGIDKNFRGEPSGATRPTRDTHNRVWCLHVKYPWASDFQLVEHRSGGSTARAADWRTIEGLRDKIDAAVDVIEPGAHAEYRIESVLVERPES